MQVQVAPGSEACRDGYVADAAADDVEVAACAGEQPAVTADEVQVGRTRAVGQV